LASPRFNGREPGAMLGEPCLPVLETPGWNRQRDLDAEPDAEPACRRIPEGKKRQIRTRMSVRVGVEQMVRGGIVLIDALLHEAHAEHAGVEVEILLRVAADRGDVM